ncbi:DUF6777 domain-containing protein [Streptomyces sp. NBRC 110028]|uniref:DUF6777 domain-containing protein n=1 Tax=Streptomyces sp. NBRC 110028 TaxID=1621260 RepID=UPI0006E3B7EA|nr:DUF6777 domain-containing protein [Streptomyces sp. NBRC 110028]
MRSISWHLTSRRSGLAAGSVAVVSAVAVLGTVTPSGWAATAEYRREPVGKTSVPAFTSAVGHDRRHVVSPSNGGRAFQGDTPGLYAGTPGRRTCDRQELIRDLKAAPKKAAAWSKVQHIRPVRIRAYAHRLSGVVLRSDTYARTYGYQGRVKPAATVLQAGTAVFVDRKGMPVVKCASGNPISAAAPKKGAELTFTGPQWSGFSRNAVTVIRPAPDAVKRITVVTSGKSELFRRVIGVAKGKKARDVVLSPSHYPKYLAMPGEQNAPNLAEAPKRIKRHSPLGLETIRPSDTPSLEPSEPPDQSQQPTDPGQQPTDPGQQPSDPGQQPTDPGQQPTDPGQQPSDPGQQPPPNQQPSDPGQQSQQPQQQPPPQQPTDPNQQNQQQQPPPPPPPQQPPPQQPPPPPPPQQPPPQQQPPQ